MAKFRIHVFESSMVCASKVFEADTEADAVELAEADDWRQWEPSKTDANSYIDYIEVVEP